MKVLIVIPAMIILIMLLYTIKEAIAKKQSRETNPATMKNKTRTVNPLGCYHIGMVGLMLGYVVRELSVVKSIKQ